MFPEIILTNNLDNIDNNISTEYNISELSVEKSV